MVKVVIATLKAASARIKDISFSYNAAIEESNCQEIFNACILPPLCFYLSAFGQTYQILKR
jgi:hypothetical protein